ncbi:class A beta-lactamase [Catenulispora sp. NF23]|uniref:class A beta-lactamase n=1 Tax=Catenulispora pinistramenti TaxID=2705254 RepID=UPI001BAD24E4|nr:class A beta-lactamase [Catenulispora pinistramenti]MBS2536227.1 class A beta-lactamase [Catenulispora pinistramenti]
MRRFTVAVAASLGLAATTLAGCSSASHATSAGAGAGAGAAATSPSASGATSTPSGSPTATATDTAAFTALQSRYHAQLGLYALDTGSGRTVAFQADQRFASCSTVKALVAAELLRRETDAQLNQTITYSAADLVDYSPVTSQHVTGGMSLTAVMTAAVEVSDNTALNLMLTQLGGPPALQTALRGLNDPTTNADRTEPTINSATPGDTRDTSTPRALAEDLRAYALGDVLTPQRRAMLTGWLTANTTGGPYIRAAVPPGWTVGDKTGNGDYGTRNDIAVLWPPHRAPIVIAVLSNRGDAKDASSGDALIADATKVALQGLGT